MESNYCVCVCTVPYIAGVMSNEGNKRLKMWVDKYTPCCQGRVNNHEVTVMIDTGSSTCVVKKSLVKPEQYTGSYSICMLIDGVIKRFPTAVIEVDTPYYRRTTKALCMENPVQELIIGNIQGAVGLENTTSHHPSLPLSSIPDLKRTRSTNPSHHRSSSYPPTAHWTSTGLPSRTSYHPASCFSSSVIFLLVDACVGLNWLLVSFLSHVNKNIIHSFVHSNAPNLWHTARRFRAHVSPARPIIFDTFFHNNYRGMRDTYSLQAVSGCKLQEIVKA